MQWLIAYPRKCVMSIKLALLIALLRFPSWKNFKSKLRQNLFFIIEIPYRFCTWAQRTEWAQELHGGLLPLCSRSLIPYQGRGSKNKKLFGIPFPPSCKFTGQTKLCCKKRGLKYCCLETSEVRNRIPNILIEIFKTSFVSFVFVGTQQ